MLYWDYDGRLNKFAVEFLGKKHMDYFIINVSVANVYQEPSFNSPMATQALLGESCSIIGQSNNWYRIQQWDGYEGWVNQFYGIIQNNIYESNSIFYHSHGVIRNEKNQPIRIINFGSRLSVVEEENSYAVTLPDDQKGVIDNGLRVDPFVPSRESITKLAKSFLGISYQWGGKTTQGFDCSGFVQTIFKAHGIDFPRDSYQQADRLQNNIELENIQKGDLLFFAEGDQISHVAISLGGFELINARGWVRIESLDPIEIFYSKKLKNLFVKALSIEEVLNS